MSYSTRVSLVKLPSNLQKIKLVSELIQLVLDTYKGVNLSTLKNDIEFIEHVLSLLKNGAKDIQLPKDIKIEDLAVEILKDLFDLSADEVTNVKKAIEYITSKKLVQKVKFSSLLASNVQKFFLNKIL